MGNITVDEYDVNEQKHKHAMDKEREQTKRVELEASRRVKEARAETAKTVGIGAVVSGSIVTVIYLIGSWIMQPEPAGYVNPDIQRENACVTNGGVWVAEDLLAQSSDPICLYPGRPASAQVPSK